MAKSFKKLTVCLVLVLALGVVAACSSGSGSSAGSSSASGSSAAVTLDKNIDQAPLTYSVNAQWKQSGGKTGESSSEYKFETGEGTNVLTVNVEDAEFADTPTNEFEKLHVSWVDYQGATDWQSSKASTVKVAGRDCIVYQCSWKLKNGDAVNMKIGYIEVPDGLVTISYFYDTGDASIFDAVVASMKLA